MSDDNLDWIDGMIEEHGGGNGTFNAERYEELMRAAEGGNSGDGGRGNGQPGNGRQLTREEIESFLDIPEGGGDYNLNMAPGPQEGVGRFLLGTLKSVLSYEARSRVARHVYSTNEAVEKFQKKFYVRPVEANGDVVRTDDNLTFAHEGSGHFSYVDCCPKCGQITKAKRTKHYPDFARMIVNFTPYRDHRCGAPNKEEEELEQLLDGLQPAPPPEPKQEEPPRRVQSSRRDPHFEGDGGVRWVSSDSTLWREQDADQDLRYVPDGPDEQPQAQQTEVDQQRRARELQAQRQPGTRAVGQRRPRQQQESRWPVVLFLIVLLAVGVAIVAGAISLRGRTAEGAGAVQQPAVQLAAVPVEAAGQVAVEQATVEPTNTPLPPETFQQQQVAPAVPQAGGSSGLVWDEVVAGSLWETMYQGVSVRIGRGGPNGTTHLIYWEQLDAGHQATFGASAGTLEEAQALAYRLTVEEWNNLPTLLGWE